MQSSPTHCGRLPRGRGEPGNPAELGELELPPGDARLGVSLTAAQPEKRGAAAERAQMVRGGFLTVGEFEDVPGVFDLRRKASPASP